MKLQIINGPNLN